MKKLICLITTFLIGSISYAQSWVNDAATLFKNNGAVILTINMRNFAAVDIDGNGIIQPKKGEIKGNFLNSIARLDELTRLGINTIHILPINPVGKRKAYGSAGNLFSVSDFTSLNPDFKSIESSLIIELQAKQFIDECHKRNIRVLVELPAYASYDLYLKKPGLFLKDSRRNSIMPYGQKDLRILNAGTNTKLNSAVYNMYEKYLDLLMSIGVDGVVVQDPYVKPAKFWANLISHAKTQNQEFIFIAEMSPSQKKNASKLVSTVGLKRLLRNGFDGFYGDFNNILDWHNASDLYNRIHKNNKYIGNSTNKKSVVGVFSSYKDLSPILVNDVYLSKMIIWLNSTLPVNSMYLDGFQYGDDYDFDWANLKSLDSVTDCDVYFTNRGKFDLYNYSRRPAGMFKEITTELIKANKFKLYLSEFVPNGTLYQLKTNFESVFAYAISDNLTNNSVFVIGNFDLDNIFNVEIEVPKINSKFAVNTIKSITVPQIKRNKIYTVIGPYDIQVFTVKGFSIKP